MLSLLLFAQDCKYYYKVGAIDPIYKISEYELKNLLKDIEYEWEYKVGMNFLEYNENNENSTPINLIYNKDIERYEFLNDNIENHKVYGEALKDKEYQINLTKNNIDERQLEWSIKLKKFNKLVSSGKISKYKYKNQKNDLEYEQKNLNNDIRKFQEVLQKYNEEVDYYRENGKKIKTFKKDQNLDNHEKRGVTKIIKEQYIKKNIFGNIVNKTEVIRAEAIDIYRVNNLNELKLIIAHEMGHMFGLGHTQIKGALMHPLIQDLQKDKFKVTLADIDMAKTHLRKKCF